MYTEEYVIWLLDYKGLMYKECHQEVHAVLHTHAENVGSS